MKTKAAELGMNYIELTSDNSPAKQMNNVRTAITRGVNAIVMGPVSSTSTPPVLRFLKEKQIPIAFTGIGPQPGQTDYTSAVTANNYETGKAEGSFVCKLAKERGGNKVGMLSLPQDRENAQKYLNGAQESFKADGCDLVAVLETHGLTVSEAVAQANDLLTAHPDIKAIYGMYDEAAPAPPRRCRRAVSSARSRWPPRTAARPRSSCCATARFRASSCRKRSDRDRRTQQVYNALTGKPTTKDIAFTEPLVTKETIDQPDAQKVVKRVYPPSAGKY